MTENVQRAGSAAGLTPLLPRQAMRVGLLVGWATAVAAARNPRPRQRPVGALWVAVAAAGGLLGLQVGGVRGMVTWATGMAAAYFLIIMVLGLVIEGRLFARADRVWLINSQLGRACAKVNVTGSGAWDLTSVAARPFKRHLGSHLVGAICCDADNEGREIILQAQNDRVARLYTRHQFVDDPGRDRRAMRRAPNPVGSSGGLVREATNLG